MDAIELDSDSSGGRPKYSPPKKGKSKAKKLGEPSPEEKAEWTERWQKFHMESQVRAIMAELQAPINKSTKTILEEVQANRDKWVDLDSRLGEAVEGLNRAQRGLLDFRDISPRMERMSQMQADMQQKMFNEQQHVAEKLRALTTGLGATKRELDDLKGDMSSFLRKSETIETALQAVEDTKERMQIYVDEMSKSIESRWALESEKQGRFINQMDQQSKTIDSFKDFMQATDVRVRSFEKEIEHLMDLSVEAVQGLKDVNKWNNRIDGIEEEMSQIRRITEQNVIGLEKKLRTAVKRKDLDTTILHFFCDFIDEALFKLQEPAGLDGMGFVGSVDKTEQRNYRLSDQLRLDLRAWQVKTLAKYENPYSWCSEIPEDLGVYGGQNLPNSSHIRGLAFKEELEYPKLHTPAPYDDFGQIRKNSADGSRKKLERLEEYGDSKPFGGMTKEELKMLSPEARAKVWERERQRRKYRLDKRSKSWTIPRGHINYEAPYISYTKALEESQKYQVDQQFGMPSSMEMNYPGSHPGQAPMNMYPQGQHQQQIARPQRRQRMPGKNQQRGRHPQAYQAPTGQAPGPFNATPQSFPSIPAYQSHQQYQHQPQQPYSGGAQPIRYGQQQQMSMPIQPGQNPGAAMRPMGVQQPGMQHPPGMLQPGMNYAPSQIGSQYAQAQQRQMAPVTQGQSQPLYQNSQMGYQYPSELPAGYPSDLSTFVSSDIQMGNHQYYNPYLLMPDPSLGLFAPDETLNRIQRSIPVESDDSRPHLGKESRLGKMQADLLLSYPPTMGPKKSGSSRKAVDSLSELRAKYKSKGKMTTWGKEMMEERPEGVKWLVLLDGIVYVEQTELKEYDKKLRRDMMYTIHDKLEQYDEIQKKEGIRMLNEVDQRIAYAKAEVRLDIQRVVDVDLTNLDQVQQQRQEELKKYLESEIEKVSNDLSTRFEQQSKWNKDALEKVRQQAKAMLKIRSDMYIEQDKLGNVQARLAGALREIRTEFAKVLDIVSSVLELQYLSQGLEFQDEIDRHKMGLWAATYDDKYTKDKEKKQEGQQSQRSIKEKRQASQHATIADGPSLQLDEDCLSCCLEKYRPAIKAAFKMACLTYKPSGVPFNGIQYDRTSLINLKRQMIEDIVNKQIAQTDYFYELKQAITATQTRIRVVKGQEPSDQDSYQKDIEDEIENEMAPEKPPHWTFKDSLMFKLHQLDQQVKEEDHVAARKLDLDIKECLLDRNLKDQIIRNQPVANLAMLYDAIAKEGDTVPLNRYKEGLKADEERLNTFQPNQSFQSSERMKKKILLDMRSSAYINDKRSSMSDIDETGIGSSTKKVEEPKVQASGDSKKVKSMIESILEEHEPEVDDLKELRDIDNPALNSIQRHDSKTTNFKSMNRTQASIRSPKKQGRELNADIKNQLMHGGDLIRTNALSPQVKSSHIQIEQGTNTDEKRDENFGFRFQQKSQIFTPMNHYEDKSLKYQTSYPQQKNESGNKIGRLSKMNLRNNKDFIGQSILHNQGQRSLSQLNMANININDGFLNNRSHAAFANMGGVRDQGRQNLGDSSPQSFDLRENKMPLPHRRKGLLSSLNFISGKSGKHFPPPLDIPAQPSIGSLGGGGGPTADATDNVLDKHSSLISTVHSIHAASPLKTSHTTKADARQVHEALLNLSISQKDELLQKMKQSNKSIKNLDNLAVITGLPSDKLRERVGEVGQVREIAMAQISALTAKQAKGHGTGYLFSRQLVDSLQSPHAATNQRLPGLSGRGSTLSPDNSTQMERRLELEAAAEKKSGEVRALGAFDQFRNMDKADRNALRAKRSKQSKAKQVLDSSSRGSALRLSHGGINEGQTGSGRKREGGRSIPKTPSTGTRDREKASPRYIIEMKSNNVSPSDAKNSKDNLTAYLDQNINQVSGDKKQSQNPIEGSVVQGQAIKTQKTTNRGDKSQKKEKTSNRVSVSFLSKIGEIADKKRNVPIRPPFGDGTLHGFSDISSDEVSKRGGMNLDLTMTSQFVPRQDDDMQEHENE